MHFLRRRLALVLFAGAGATALGCSLIVEYDEARIPSDVPTDTGVEAAIDTGTPIIDSGSPSDSAPVDSDGTDTAVPDTADSAAPDAGDTAAPDTADTAAPDTADTAAPDTADTAPPDTEVADSAPADTSDGGPTVSFAADIQPIFSARCTSCHSGGGASGGMSLASGEAYGNLVGVAANCTPGSFTRVVAFSTTTSLLWLKTSDDPSKCGSAMPLGTAGLKTIAPADFAKLETWILEGALNN